MKKTEAAVKRRYQIVVVWLLADFLFGFGLKGLVDNGYDTSAGFWPAMLLSVSLATAVALSCWIKNSKTEDQLETEILSRL